MKLFRRRPYRVPCPQKWRVEKYRSWWRVSSPWLQTGSGCVRYRYAFDSWGKAYRFADEQARKVR